MMDKRNPRTDHAAADAALIEVFRQGFADGAAGKEPAAENPDRALSDTYHEGYQQGGVAADKAVKEQKHDVYSRHSRSVRAAELVAAVAGAMKEFGNLPMVIKAGNVMLSMEHMAITKGRDELGNRVLVLSVPVPKKK